MASRKHLISKTLSQVGGRIIGLQCQLALFNLEHQSRLEALFDLEDEMDEIRTQIKGLKDKANWEFGEARKLATNRAQPPGLALPPPPAEDGEDWKRASG